MCHSGAMPCFEAVMSRPTGRAGSRCAKNCPASCSEVTYDFNIVIEDTDSEEICLENAALNRLGIE